MRVVFISSYPLVEKNLPFLTNHEVVFASTVEEAICLMGSQHFDIAVVFDNLNDVPTSPTAVAKIRQKFAEIPIVFLGYTEQSLNMAKACGADKVVALPHFFNNKTDILEEVVFEVNKRKFFAPGYFEEEKRKEKGD